MNKKSKQGATAFFEKFSAKVTKASGSPWAFIIAVLFSIVRTAGVTVREHQQPDQPGRPRAGEQDHPRQGQGGDQDRLQAEAGLQPGQQEGRQGGQDAPELEVVGTKNAAQPVAVHAATQAAAGQRLRPGVGDPKDQQQGAGECRSGGATVVVPTGVRCEQAS